MNFFDRLPFALQIFVVGILGYHAVRLVSLRRRVLRERSDP